MESDIIIGERNVWGQNQPFGLGCVDRRQHLYLIGQTGTGKSSLLHSLMAQDIAGGEGCALIDPHGDLFEQLLATIPPYRIDDTLLLEPGDLAHPLAWNPFYHVPEDDRPRVASNLTAALRHVWRDSWGARLEYILFNAISAVLDAPDYLRPTFLSVPRMLVDERYRAAVVDAVRNPQVRMFWQREFAKWNDRFLDEALSPVQNKIGAILSSPALRNILGQWRSALDIASVMRERKILLINLARGKLGEDKANLMGALIVADFQATAMGRVGEPEAARRDYYLYVDEFQCFGTDIFASILSEARKFGLSLTLANQYLAQVPTEISDAILGNVGSIVSFRVGAEDADRLARELGDYSPASLRGLGRGAVCARLQSDGEVGQAFMGRTLPCWIKPTNNRATLRCQSRQRYCNDRATVEGRIRAWLGNMDS